MPLETPYRVTNPPEFVFENRDRVRGLRDQNWYILCKAFRSGDRKRLRKALDAFFKNKSNRSAYLYEAGMRFPNVREWETEVAFFNPFKPLQHGIMWWRQPKAKGGVRYLCDLSPYMKAAHLMITDVIHAQMDVPCFIYNVKQTGNRADRTGRNALVRRLIALLQAGYTHYRIFDVRDCFQSINPDATINLPLPRRIYENTLNLNNLCFQHDLDRERRHIADSSLIGDIMDTGGASGPEGLLQGSPCSNVILAYLLQHLPQPNPEECCILLYGDDLIVLSRTETIAHEVDETVTQFFEQSSFGPLHLHRRAAGHCGHFEYLGYDFSYSEIADEWQVGLSARNWDKLEKARNEEALKHWPTFRLGVDFHIRRRMMRSLAGHPALSDPQAICDALVDGGWDNAELAARDQQQRLCR